MLRAILFAQETIMHYETCFSQSGCTSAHRWELADQFLGLLCLHAQLLLYLVNCLYLNPQTLMLLPSQISPPSCSGESERTAVWCQLPARVKAQHVHRGKNSSTTCEHAEPKDSSKVLTLKVECSFCAQRAYAVFYFLINSLYTCELRVQLNH